MILRKRKKTFINLKKPLHLPSSNNSNRYASATILKGIFQQQSTNFIIQLCSIVKPPSNYFSQPITEQISLQWFFHPFPLFKILKASYANSMQLVLNHNHNHFTTHFLGPPGWAGARRNLLDFMVLERITTGSHTDNPSGHISNPPPSIPPFLCQMPFLLQPSQFILAWDRHRNTLDCIPPWLTTVIIKTLHATRNVNK